MHAISFNPGQRKQLLKMLQKKELAGVLAVVYEKEIVRVFIHDASKNKLGFRVS